MLSLILIGLGVLALIFGHGFLAIILIIVGLVLAAVGRY